MTSAPKQTKPATGGALHRWTAPASAANNPRAQRWPAVAIGCGPGLRLLLK